MIKSIARLIGWSGDSFRALKAYCRILALSRTLGGARAASTSISNIGAILKAPSIFRRPRF